MASILELTHWHWLSLGLILFAVEALGVGGYLLGVAAAAVATAVLAWMGGGWQLQLIVFALLSCIFSVAYWKFFKHFNLEREGETLVVNEKMQTLLGKQGEVLVSTNAHSGKLKIADTLWEFESADSLAPGDKAIVESYKGMILTVVKS